jgi:hypothetical protein
MVYNRSEQYDIFDQIFQTPLQRYHELILLGQRIVWGWITARLLPSFSKRGHQGRKIRLMAGVHILKNRFGLSDEEVVQGLYESVYWMRFCGVRLQERSVNAGEGREEVLPRLVLESSTMPNFFVG